jgi:hypothetical protein
MCVCAYLYLCVYVCIYTRHIAYSSVASKQSLQARYMYVCVYVCIRTISHTAAVVSKTKLERVDMGLNEPHTAIYTWVSHARVSSCKHCHLGWGTLVLKCNKNNYDSCKLYIWTCEVRQDPKHIVLLLQSVTTFQCNQWQRFNSFWKHLDSGKPLKAFEPAQVLLQITSEIPAWLHLTGLYQKRSSQCQLFCKLWQIR